MADNVDITPGTGATVAADLVAAALHQRVKLSLGADGTAVDAGAGAGAVGTDTQRVTLGSDDPAVVSLQLIDDVVKTDDNAFTPGTTKVLMIGAEADETAADSVDEGDAGALRMTLARALHSNPRASDGTEIQPIVDTVLVTASITREANTTAYAAGDAVSDSATTPTALTFSNCARSAGGRCRIVGWRAYDSAAPTTKGFFTLLLFNKAIVPDTGANFDDNVALALTDAQIDGTTCNLVGKIDMNVWMNPGPNAFASGECWLELETNTTAHLYGVVVVNNAYQSSANSNVLTFGLVVARY